MKTNHIHTSTHIQNDIIDTLKYFNSHKHIQNILHTHSQAAAQLTNDTIICHN